MWTSQLIQSLRDVTGCTFNTITTPGAPPTPAMGSATRLAQQMESGTG